jgi:hypothetical protein
MYITLEPDLKIENNSNSSFVTILPEPLILEGTYNVGISEFYYPNDFSVLVGILSFSVPYNYSENFQNNENNIKEKLNALFERLKAKIATILINNDNVKLKDQLLAELELIKYDICVFISDRVILKSLHNVYDIFYETKKIIDSLVKKIAIM